jgi:flagellar basal-body rod protein FlgB
LRLGGETDTGPSTTDGQTMPSPAGYHFLNLPVLGWAPGKLPGAGTMFEDLTLFAMAQRQIDYLARRQSVLSENVANANTPEYKVKDLAPVNFKDLMGPPKEAVRAAVTNPMHISPEVASVNFEEVNVRRPEESKPDGNQVLIEDQMQKIGEVKGDYELTVNLMMKNISMLKTALDKNG